MSLVAIFFSSFAVLFALLFVGRTRAAWVAAVAVALVGWVWVGVESPRLLGASALAFGAAVMPRVARLLPRLGDTERIALEAGTVSFEGDFFAGRFPWGADLRGPDDALGAETARALLDAPELRERLTASIHVPPASEPGLGRLEDALRHARRALAVEARIRRAVREGMIDHAPGDVLAEKALAAGVIGAEERA